jgi:hypothetical protein
MHAYANPEDRSNELKRADGFGVARFNKKDRSVTFECWPRFSKVSDGDKAQFAGWPITFKAAQNDGRKIKGWLPKLNFSKPNPVVQVINDKTKEVLYTIRVKGKTFQPKVYSEGKYTIKAGANSPIKVISSEIPSKEKRKDAGNLKAAI